MSDSYTIKATQQKFSALVDEVADHPVTITKQGKAVAVMMSIDRLEAIAEAMEMLADPKPVDFTHLLEVIAELALAPLPLES